MPTTVEIVRRLKYTHSGIRTHMHTQTLVKTTNRLNAIVSILLTHGWIENFNCAQRSSFGFSSNVFCARRVSLTAMPAVCAMRCDATNSARGQAQCYDNTAIFLSVPLFVCVCVHCTVHGIELFFSAFSFFIMYLNMYLWIILMNSWMYETNVCIRWRCVIVVDGALYLLLHVTHTLYIV